MNKLALIILIIILPLSGFAQKFMIKNGDTLLYKQTINVHNDTSYYGDRIIYPGDTTYTSACNTFEKRNGKIINRRTAKCLPIGFWIKEHEDGTISKGNYSSKGKLTGIWKTYDKKGKLIKEKEYASIANDTYVLREVLYKNGQAIIVKDKTAFAKFYYKNVFLISIVLLIAFFSRMLINSPIYNGKNGTNYSPIYFHLGPLATKNFSHSLLCTFTFWWKIGNLKHESRLLGRISNLLSIIALGLFFVILIRLGLSNELT